MVIWPFNLCQVTLLGFYASTNNLLVSPPFEELIKSSILGKLFNISVRVPSVDNLIKLKEGAIGSAEKDLNKHRQDIQLLRNHAHR